MQVTRQHENGDTVVGRIMAIAANSSIFIGRQQYLKIVPDVTLFFLCQALIPNAIAVTKHPMNAQKTGSRNIDFMLTSPLSREI
jgi:hypothetical protein